jgi:peptidyl-tRNA hydrolase ICT1
MMLSQWTWRSLPGVLHQRPILRALRYQAFDSTFNPEDLTEARQWHESFQLSSIPKGSTSYSRSSGPGGQHVNKYLDPMFFSDDDPG